MIGVWRKTTAAIALTVKRSGDGPSPLRHAGLRTTGDLASLPYHQTRNPSIDVALTGRTKNKQWLPTMRQEDQSSQLRHY